MRGRVFDPHTGTFLQLDPEGLVDSTNPYAGFAHDTVNNRDPTGRFLFVPFLWGLAEAGVIGAGIVGWLQTYDTVANNNLRSNDEVFNGLGAGMAAGVASSLSFTAAAGAAGAGYLAAGVSSVAGGSTFRGLSGEEVTLGTAIFDATVGLATLGLFRGAAGIGRWLDRKLLPQFDLTGVLGSTARALEGPMPTQFTQPAQGAARAATLGSEGGLADAATLGAEGAFGSGLSAAGATGRLRALGGGAWESAAGLRYGPGSAQGNRVLHVLEHAADIPGRASPHGVFAGGRGSVIGTIDETYCLARAGGSRVSVAQQGVRTVYTVDMGRSVGFVGGQTGAALGNPAASHIRLVLEGTDVITAFPVIP
jgi:hypothetical protein